MHRPLRGEWVFFRKDEWVLGRLMKSMIFLTKVCVCGVTTSLRIGETPGGLWQPSSLWGSVLRQIRGVQRRFLPAFAVFKLLIPQNKHFTKVSYFLPFDFSVPKFSLNWKAVRHVNSQLHGVENSATLGWPGSHEFSHWAKPNWLIADLLLKDKYVRNRNWKTGKIWQGQI